LDLGCGTGVHIELLKELGFTVFGLDVNTHQLRSAKELYHNLNSVLCNANMIKIPFQSSCFDLVTYMSESINYLDKEDVKNSLKETYRCLRPGGAIIIVAKWAKNLGGRGFEESYKNGIRYSKHWITRTDVPEMNPDEAIWNAEFEDLKTGHKQKESHYFPFMNPFAIAEIATELGFINTEVLDIHSIYETKIPLLKESSERTAIIIASVNKI
jgi:SAM-dependent methyltransferase